MRWVWFFKEKIIHYIANHRITAFDAAFLHGGGQTFRDRHDALGFLGEPAGQFAVQEIVEIVAVVAGPVFGDDIGNLVLCVQQPCHQSMPGHDVAMDQIRFAELLEHRPKPHFICRNEVSEPL